MLQSVLIPACCRVRLCSLSQCHFSLRLTFCSITLPTQRMTKNVHFHANRKKGTFQLAETIQKGTEIAETDMIKSREHETKTSVDELSGVTTSSMA